MMSDIPSLTEFVALTDFRVRYQLPLSFGIVSLFPKDFTGLGSIHPYTGDSLREGTLLPNIVFSRDTVDLLIARFHDSLELANQHVKLSLEQVGFAEAGFADMLWHVFYARVNRPDVPTDTLIEEFIQASLHLSSETISYTHGDEKWHICTVSSVFGRVGLRVTMPQRTVYVCDERYLCPMEGFIRGVVREVES